MESCFLRWRREVFCIRCGFLLKDFEEDVRKVKVGFGLVVVFEIGLGEMKV